MTTVTQGNSSTVTLSRESTINLTVPAAGALVVHITRGGLPVFGARVPTSRTIGTFQIGDVVTVTAQRGSVDYVVSPVGPSAVAQATQGLGIRSAITAYKRGLRTRPPIIFGIGDSNFTGEGAGDGLGAVPKLNNAFGYGPIEQIATVVPTLAGLPIRTTAWFGEGNSANNVSTASEYNSKITLGTDWVRTVGVDAPLMGKFFQGNPNSAGYMTYSFGSAITDVEVYVIVNGTNSASVGVYNSSNTLIQTLNTNNATATASAFQVTGSFPDGIVKFKNNGAANCYVCANIAWNSAEKSILLVRGSYSGAAVGDYTATTNVWSGMGFFPAIKPDLTIVSLTINDIFAGTTRSNYNTGLSYIADFVVRYGDLIVSTGGNGSAAGWTNGTSQGIEAEAKIVASKFGAPFVSLHKEWGSWTATNAIGQEFDGNHRTRAGYLDQAGIYASLLASIMNR